MRPREVMRVKNEVTKTTKYLRYIINDEQKRIIAQSMAESLKAISQLEANLKSVSTQLRAEIARHRATLLENSEKYRSGFEMKNVECRIEKDFNAGIVSVFRTDTFEAIESRPMEDSDRQAKLPIEKDKD
jgi:hypothetical protein